MLTDMPIVVPCYNNPTYLGQMLAQLQSRKLENVIIVDNASTFPPMLDLLSDISRTFRVIQLRRNHGPRYFCDNWLFYWKLPNFFCVTDPDIRFSDNMPTDFLEILAECTIKFNAGKAGLALDISMPHEMRPIVITHLGVKYSIVEWERKFWTDQISETEGGDPIYRATTDTTFAVYNKRLFRKKDFENAVRVGGRFTAKHIPWCLDNELPQEEEAYYRTAATHSWYFR